MELAAQRGLRTPQRHLNVLEPYPPALPEDVRPWLGVRRGLRHGQRKRTGRVELVGILLVLVVGLGTAWWVSPRISIGVSDLVSMPEDFGFVRNGNPPRRLVGYDSNSTIAWSESDPLSASKPALTDL
jgi:hypothetical protein